MISLEFLPTLIAGKSLYVKRLFEQFKREVPTATFQTIRLIEPYVDMHGFVQTLSERLGPLREQDPLLLHIDAAAVCFTKNILIFAIIACTIIYYFGVTNNIFLSHFGLLLMDFLNLQVRHGLEEFLFKLLILGCLSDSEGTIWRRNAAHLVAIEVLQLGQKSQTQMEVECLLCNFCYVLVTFCSLSHN